MSGREETHPPVLVRDRIAELHSMVKWLRATACATCGHPFSAHRPAPKWAADEGMRCVGLRCKCKEFVDPPPALVLVGDEHKRKNDE